MKTVYVVFTSMKGYTFYICHTEAKGFFVSSSAPDSEVAQWTTREAAQKVADDNSKDDIRYEVKPIEI